MGFFPKDRTYRAFLHNKLFFLIAPRDLRYLWASAQPCAALCNLEQLTTPLLASGKATNGVFSLRIAHIAPSLCFCTKGIFFGWSQRDWMHLGPLCMELRAPDSFVSLWEGQKWGFFPKDRTYRAFLPNKRFLLIVPTDLRYYWARAQPCAALRS